MALAPGRVQEETALVVAILKRQGDCIVSGWALRLWRGTDRFMAARSFLRHVIKTLWKEAHPNLTGTCSTKRRSIHPQLLHSSKRLALARTSKEKGQIPLLVAG